jgi:hypothetical protein
MSQCTPKLRGMAKRLLYNAGPRAKHVLSEIHVLSSKVTRIK